ncbi:acyltransferase family protein [Methylobacterium sp. A54F]
MHVFRTGDHILDKSKFSDVSVRTLINASQAFGMVLIISYHIHILLSPMSLSHWRFYQLLGFFGVFLMPMFFLFAGLSLSRIWRHKSYCFAKSRLISYSWLFLLWSAIYTCENIIFGVIQGKNIHGLIIDLMKEFLYPTSFLWFIYNLCIYIGISRFIPYRNRYLFLTAVLLMQVVCSVYDSRDMDRFIKCLLFFSIGYVLPNSVKKFITVVTIPRALVACFVYTVLYAASSEDNGLFRQLVDCGMTFLGVYWFSQASVIFYIILNSSHANKLACMNLQMYLMHMPILLLIVMPIRISGIHINNNILTVVAPIIYLSVTLIVCFKIHNLLKAYSSLFSPPQLARRIGASILTRISSLLHRTPAWSAQ